MKRLFFLLLLAGGSIGISAADLQPSGSLPVLYIHTQNGQEITSKEDYLSATYYIDNTGHSQYPSTGSAQAPLTMQIRGRGNWTWTGFNKKPYRLKLDTKQGLLGMKKSKHWALMAGADDNLGFLRNPMGYYLSRYFHLRWSPSQVPVEVMLNGKYRGLYFLTETIRVDKDRVAIAEQEDESSSSETMSGGWLVEIDNYRTDGNVELTEGNGQRIMFTMHSPEVLSSVQRDYITAQLHAINRALYATPSDSLEMLMDIDEAARYYLVQELLEDCESYHGSCYLYKNIDRADSTEKWMFGPVWDFGNSFMRQANRFIYDGPTWPQYWIGQLATHEVFRQRVLRHWFLFYKSGKYEAYQEIERFASQIAEAAKTDAKRWQGQSPVCINPDMSAAKTKFYNLFNWRINWLYSQWGKGIDPTAVPEVAVDGKDTGKVADKIFRNGQLIIVRQGVEYDMMGRKVE